MCCSTDTFRSLIRAARNAGTPLLAVRTADPASAITHVTECAASKDGGAVFAWDFMTGVTPRGKVAQEVAARTTSRRGCAVSALLMA